jgi:hypothetical protein
MSAVTQWNRGLMAAGGTVAMALRNSETEPLEAQVEATAD